MGGVAGEKRLLNGCKGLTIIYYKNGHRRTRTHIGERNRTGGGYFCDVQFRRHITESLFFCL